jgi:hypothetical protein
VISERTLAYGFESFWREQFPFLTPLFIRNFNAGKKERIVTPEGVPVRPVPMSAEVQDFDLSTEIGFEIATERYRERIGQNGDEQAAVRRASSRIAALRKDAEWRDPLEADLKEGRTLAELYEFLFDSISAKEEVTFRPQIKGAGILNSMEADFCTARTLFEVKSVNRNLQSVDVRQLLCYLVAGLGSKEYAWEGYCFFNPRLAVSYTGSVNELLGYLSGQNPSDAVADTMDALMHREELIEWKF